MTSGVHSSALALLLVGQAVPGAAQRRTGSRRWHFGKRAIFDGVCVVAAGTA